MTATQDYELEQLTLVDDENREIGVILNGITFSLEWDEDQGWQPMSAIWGDPDERLWSASYLDADKATWRLLESSFRAGQHDCRAADMFEAPTNEYAEA